MRFAWISLPLWLAFQPAFAELAQSSNDRVRILVQSSPLAGSQYHRLNRHRDAIKAGDALDLAREPDNPYDHNAVSVRWRGEMLGYLPRKENRAVAAAIDRGDAVKASVERIGEDRDPWKRLRISVFIEF